MHLMGLDCVFNFKSEVTILKKGCLKLCGGGGGVPISGGLQYKAKGGKLKFLLWMYLHQDS